MHLVSQESLLSPTQGASQSSNTSGMSQRSEAPEYWSPRPLTPPPQTDVKVTKTWCFCLCSCCKTQEDVYVSPPATPYQHQDQQAYSTPSLSPAPWKGGWNSGRYHNRIDKSPETVEQTTEKVKKSWWRICC